MSYSFYSFLHITALFAVIMSLSSIVFHIAHGGTKGNLKNRKLLSITHGVSLLVAFVAGFGLMARTGFSFSTSPWLYIKVLCWLLLGVYPLFIYRGWVPKKFSYGVLFAVLAVAIYTVVFKPAF